MSYFVPRLQVLAILAISVIAGRIIDPVGSLKSWSVLAQGGDAHKSPPRKVTFRPDPRGRPKDGCLAAELVRGAEVHMLGVYESLTMTDLAFQDHDDAVGTVGVSAKPAGPPLVLLLGSSESTVWDFRRFPVGRLRAVLILTDRPQAVANLPEDVFLRFVSSESEVDGCGLADSAFKADRYLVALQNSTKKALGVGFTSFKGDYATSALHVEYGSLASSNLPEPSLDRITASAPIGRTGLYPGDPGLEQLEARGAIRLADDYDLVRFKIERAEAYRYYVVLRKTEMPRGMFGAKSHVFLVPSGVPMPRDLGSHNKYVRQGS